MYRKQAVHGLTVSYGGLLLSGRPFDYRPGAYLTGQRGLDFGSEVSFENLSAGRGPGVADLPGVRDTPRGIELTGFLYHPSLLELGERRERLLGIYSDETILGPLSWRDFGLMRRAMVRRDSATAPRRGSTGFVDFTLKLRAPDQRIYGPEEPWTAWASSVEVVHRGQYPAPCKVQLRGTSATGYTLTGPNGRRVIVTKPISGSTVHEYDSDSGLVLADGAVLEDGITRADSIELPPGASTVSVSNGLTCRVVFSPTFNP